MSKISVIVPVYNVEDYIEKCIKSIVNQKYKNLEIIIINDGSTDKSLSICEKLQKEDSRIKIINKKNTGVADTRNIGVKKATGEYISFIDADDWINENMYLDMINAAIEYKADLVGCCEIIVNSKGNEKIVETNKKIICSGKEALDILASNDMPFQWGMCNKLYKKALFKGISHPKLDYCEDLAIIPRLLFNSKNVVHLGKAYYYVYKRPASATRSGLSKKQLLHEMQAWDSVIDFYKNNNIKGYNNILYRYFTGLRWRYTQVYCINQLTNYQRKDYANIIISKIKIISKNLNFSKLDKKAKIINIGFLNFPKIIVLLSKINMKIKKVEEWNN